MNNISKISTGYNFPNIYKLKFMWNKFYIIYVIYFTIEGKFGEMKRMDDRYFKWFLSKRLFMWWEKYRIQGETIDMVVAPI